MKKFSIFFTMLVFAVLLSSCGPVDDSDWFTYYDETEELVFTFSEWEIEELYLDADNTDIGYMCLSFKVTVDNESMYYVEIKHELREEIFTVTKDGEVLDNSFITFSDYAAIWIPDGRIDGIGFSVGRGIIPLTKNESITDFGTYTITFRGVDFDVEINSDLSVTHIAEQ